MSFPRPFIFLLLGFFLLSCESDPYDVDISSVQYDPEFLRLDRAIFDLPVPPTNEALITLKDEYGSFLNIYLLDIMRVGKAENPMTPELLHRFLKDPTWRELQEVIEEKHPALANERDRIVRAFKRYAVHFQTDSLPRLVAYNSGFNVGVYPTPRWLGVGLEWYSGSDFDIIERLPADLFPQYKRDDMQPEYLTVNAVKGWLLVNSAEHQYDDDLLARMIYMGKILFLTQALMPDVDDATLLNYTAEELEWTESHEFDIWTHFVENDLVFTQDPQEINKMMNDGPFTPGMPPDSPGGVGKWVGLQMVESYVDDHPEISLPDLMKIENGRAFLETYKPGR